MTDITTETRAALIAAGWTPPPEPFDPLLIMAREIGKCIGGGDLTVYNTGDLDESPEVQFALTKLREAQALVKRPVIDQIGMARSAAASVHPFSHNSALILDGGRDGTDIVRSALAAIKAMEGETND